MYKAVAVLLCLGFFAYLFAVDFKLNLNDPDLWWHLKTGEYLLEHKGFFDQDPFNYTSPNVLNASQIEGLRNQWLGQVLYAAAYKQFGLIGVLTFRNILIVMPMMILLVWLFRRGLNPWLSLVIVSLPAMMLSFQLFYAFERPQGISFNLILVMILLLERVRDKSRGPAPKRMDYSYWALPAVMAVWANAHAGFIVGVFVIVSYLGAEAMTLLFMRYVKKKRYELRPAFFYVCIGAIIATGANPNMFSVLNSYGLGLTSMFLKDVTRTATGGASWVAEVVLEYKPLYYFYSALSYDWLIFYWVYAALVYAVLFLKFWVRRSVDLAELFAVTLVFVFANMYARGLMFSLTVLPAYLAKCVIDIKDAAKGRMDLNLKVVVASTAAIFIGFCTYTFDRSPSMFTPGMTNEIITPWYPTRLVEFVKREQIAPPIYNYYTWGGFLMWSLYPDYKVFIDGRALDNRSSQTADAILKAFPGWESNIDAYNINAIFIPVVFRESGHIIPLAPTLINNEKWELVFLMNNSAVFVRNHPRNQDLIQKYRIDKRYIYQEIIHLENLFLQGMPNNPVFNLAKADALMGLGMTNEAKAIYQRFPLQARDRLDAMGAAGR